MGEWINSVAYRTGKTLAYGGSGFVRLVDAQSRKQLAETSVEGRAARIAFTNDGSKLIVMTEGGSTYIRDAVNLRPVGIPIRPRGFRTSYIQSYYRPPPRRAHTRQPRWQLITARRTGVSLRVGSANPAQGSRPRVAPGYHALALTPDGLTVAVGIDGGIQLVDVGTGKVRTATAGFAGSPNWLRFSEAALRSSRRTSTARSRVGTPSRREPLETLRGHSNAVQLVFSLDGTTRSTR